MNRGAAARFNAERREVVAQLLAGGTVSAHELEAALGVKRSALNGWLRRHAPDLRERVTGAPRGRKETDWTVPMVRSVPYMGPAGIRIIPGPAHVMVACGTCGRAFSRPTRRRAEQFADLHARLHREDRANRRQEAA